MIFTQINNYSKNQNTFGLPNTYGLTVYVKFWFYIRLTMKRFMFIA